MLDGLPALGGNLPTSAYSGTWLFQATTLLPNDCNLTGFDALHSTVNEVSQSGNNVMLVSGQVIPFSGTTNDKDGFDVYSDNVGVSGCTFISNSYRYEGVGDGNAIVTHTYVGQCGGKTCSAGWGGTAVRQSP